jgi:hypothetical protein
MPAAHDRLSGTSSGGDHRVTSDPGSAGIMEVSPMSATLPERQPRLPLDGELREREPGDARARRTARSGTGAPRAVTPTSRRLDAATRRRNLERVRAIRHQLEQIADIA